MYDLTGKLIEYDTEGLESEEEVIELFQHLIDCGWAWQLQGRIGRTAMDLIRAGLCHDPDTEQTSQEEETDL